LENIKKNYELILTKINNIHKASLFSKHITPKLVAVSKKQDNYKIDAALACGQKIFGENRVQEAINRWQKRLDTNKELELRLIGPLQTNKVKQSLKFFDVIETIDREKIAIEIAKNFHDKVKTKSFYIQVNTGNETQKSGIDPLQADRFINYCIKDLNLPIVGLMCIPPIFEEPSMHFLLLQKIAYRNNLSELSMGMSSDYEDAIKFGATSVRIGSLLFGERQV
jgi:pyridoxal phosphate enzyme (YggS family)|tara:strand:- start:1362 stop:2033 length:672 start_codon:yes stop_codon:yes gene_type:complete